MFLSCDATHQNGSAADVGNYLVGKGAGTVVLTTGRAGSAAFSAGCDPVYIPAYQAVKVVDTTGCGTAYAAAFLAGSLEGWPRVECMRFAAAAAALTLSEFGADMGFANRDDLLSFMSSTDALTEGWTMQPGRESITPLDELDTETKRKESLIEIT